MRKDEPKYTVCWELNYVIHIEKNQLFLNHLTSTYIYSEELMYQSITYYVCVFIIIQKLKAIFGHGLVSINESKLDVEKDNSDLLNALCKPNHPCRYQKRSDNQQTIRKSANVSFSLAVQDQSNITHFDFPHSKQIPGNTKQLHLPGNNKTTSHVASKVMTQVILSVNRPKCLHMHRKFILSYL